MSLRADSETGNLPSLNRTKLQNNSQQRTSLALRLLDLLSDFVYRLRVFFLKSIFIRKQLELRAVTQSFHLIFFVLLKCNETL